MKICKCCNIEKPITDFSKKSVAKARLQSNCNACVCEYNAAYNAKNKEKIAEKRRKYRSENKEKIAAQNRIYRAENPDKIAARKVACREKNKEKYAAREADYRAKNPEKFAAYYRNRRARKRNAEGTHTAADIRAIFDKQQGLCANCQTKLFKSGARKYHVDHIMPLALGGSNRPSNLQCLCPSCNLSKGAKHPDDWAKENGRLL